ncbi:PaaI family thioesterase [Cognatishimia sp.]|uniref:PaaI family thioesterase n=1 Tax=Cognatishimia sp. TaxID=2211648 RepID=UPI003513D575
MSHRKIANTLEELPTFEDMISMSGLDFMQGVLTGELAGPPIARTLNFALAEVDHGHVVFEGRPQFEATNPLRTVHGGWYGTILDSCMACAVMTTLEKGSYYTTLEFKVNIVKAIPIGMPVRAIGSVQHAGRSTGVAVGEIRGKDDGRLYATGSTTCIIMKS